MFLVILPLVSLYKAFSKAGLRKKRVQGKRLHVQREQQVVPLTYTSNPLSSSLPSARVSLNSVHEGDNLDREEHLKDNTETNPNSLILGTGSMRA